MAWGDSWGSSPGQNARDLAKAFYEGRSLKRGKCVTDGETYRVHGSVIAWRIKDEDVADVVARLVLGGRWHCRLLEFSFGGIGDKQNARHLQALGVKATYRSKADGAQINGCPVDITRRYTLEEIAALKPAPIVPPKVVVRAIERRCHATMEMFA